MTGILFALAAVLTASLLPMTAVLWYRMGGALPVRRVAYAAYPLSQFAFAAYAVWAAWRYQFNEVALAGVCAACAACLVLDPLLFRNLRVAEHRDALQERERLLAEQIRLQRERTARMDGMRGAAEEVRVRMVRELADIGEALVAGDVAQAHRQLTGLTSALHPIERSFCEHPVVDALLASKAAHCRELGVRLEVAASLPRTLGIPAVELCAVFANLLDNAINAAAALPEVERWVSVAARVQAGMLLVDVRNACAGEAGERPQRLHQALGEELPEHGWGQSILRQIAERRHGDFLTERLPGEYRASITLLSD